MIVTLQVPDHVSFQLVYRMERKEPYTVELDPGLEFRFLNSALQGMKYLKAVASYCGKVGTAKAVAKLATPRRSLYMILHEGRVVSAGWCTIGKCVYYKIEPDAIVIGPIWTSESVRGKGLASKALQLAINEHIRQGKSLFYIDTEKKNLPAQRVFAKSGFGDPVALYFR